MPHGSLSPPALPRFRTCFYINSFLIVSVSQIERWATIFPAYLDKKKTIAEGRRIPKEKAVENPNYVEVAEVLKAKGFQVRCVIVGNLASLVR